MRPSLVADRFTSYAIAVSTSLTLETLAAVCEQAFADDILTENQREALEALGIARERILAWRTHDDRPGVGG